MTYSVPETRLSGYNADGVPLSAPPRLVGYDASGNPRFAEAPTAASSLKEFTARAAESMRALVGGLTATNHQAAAHTEVLCPAIGSSDPAPGEPIVACAVGANGSPPIRLAALRQWATCKVFWGVFLLAHAWFNYTIYKKFTPVYTPVKCGHQSGTLDDLQMIDGGIHVGLKISVECENPNPYQIKIVGSTPGKVYIGPLVDKLETGHLKVMPGSNMGEFGSGTVHVEMSQELYGRTSELLMHHLMYDEKVPVWLELEFDVGVYMSFGLRSWGAAMPYKKYCGMNVGGLFRADHGATSRLGPLVCGTSFQELRVPDIGAKEYETDDGQMGFKASQVAKKEVEDGTKAKDWSLGVVIGASLFFGFALLLWQTLTVMGYMKPKLPALQRPGISLDKPGDEMGLLMRDHDSARDSPASEGGRDIEQVSSKDPHVGSRQGERGAYAPLKSSGSASVNKEARRSAEAEAESKENRGNGSRMLLDRVSLENLEGMPLINFTNSETYSDSGRTAVPREAERDHEEVNKGRGDVAYRNAVKKGSRPDMGDRPSAQGFEDEQEKAQGRPRADSGNARATR